MVSSLAFRVRTSSSWKPDSLSALANEHGLALDVRDGQVAFAVTGENIVVDGAVAGVGSYNLANGSAFHHSESAVLVYGGPFPQEVADLFTDDLANCRAVAVSEVRSPRPKVDPLRRALHERNLLVDEGVVPAAIAAELARGNFRWKYAEPLQG